MKPLLLRLCSTPPESYLEGWMNVWCTSVQIKQESVISDMTIRLPVGHLSPLCQALFACGHFDLLTPLIIATDEINSDWQERHICWCDESLIGADKGALFFSQIWQFRECAMVAIRAHNPAKSDITLEEAWHQVILHGWAGKVSGRYFSEKFA